MCVWTHLSPSCNQPETRALDFHLLKAFLLGITYKVQAEYLIYACQCTKADICPTKWQLKILMTISTQPLKFPSKKHNNNNVCLDIDNSNFLNLILYMSKNSSKTIRKY